MKNLLKNKKSLFCIITMIIILAFLVFTLIYFSKIVVSYQAAIKDLEYNLANISQDDFTLNLLIEYRREASNHILVLLFTIFVLILSMLSNYFIISKLLSYKNSNKTP